MSKMKGIVDILQEPNTTAPTILYKYYKFDEYTQRIFENNEIYFQSPAKFNDPFDSKVKIIYEGSKAQRKSFFKEWSPKYRPGLSRKQHLELEKLILKNDLDYQKFAPLAQQDLNDARKQMGIFCLTEEKDNILMWSHYTTHHIGFCIGFKTDNTFFARVKHVSYSKDLPFVNILESDSEKLKEKGAESLLTKAKDWSYEKEWRIVEIDGVGVKNYPEETLACVILGCKIAPENKEKIIEWCISRKTQPALYQSREKESEFGLDIIPIS